VSRNRLLGSRLIGSHRFGIVVSIASPTLFAVRIAVIPHSEGTREPVDPPPGHAERRGHGIVRPHSAGIPPTGPGAVIPVAMVIACPVLPVFAGVIAIVLAVLLAVTARILPLTLAISAVLLSLPLSIAHVHAVARIGHAILQVGGTVAARCRQ